MALSYRSILTTTAFDVADSISTLLDEQGQRHERQNEVAAGVVRLTLDSKDQVNAGVTITVITGDRETGILIERSHPLAIDEIEVLDPPVFVPELVRSLAAMSGGLPVHRPVTGEELGSWLANPTANGIAVLLLGDAESTPGFFRLRETLYQYLAGMASVGSVATNVAEQLVAASGSIQNLHEGGLLSLERGESGISIKYVPATVTRSQPKAAVRRLRRLALACQARASFGSDLDRHLEAFEEALGRMHLGVDWSKEKKALQNELRQKQDDLETALLEQDEALRELDRTRSRLAFVEKRFQEYDQAPIIDMADELDEVQPKSCLDAVQYARQYLALLRISAASAPTQQLDEYEKSFVWAVKMWGAFVALQSYATFRSEGKFLGNFLQFCDEPPFGARPFFAASIALRESESTSHNHRTRTLRTFEVPVDVNPAGRVYMEAHVKIDQKGKPAPRVHFFDDTFNTGRVYIGYIGPHLPTAG